MKKLTTQEQVEENIKILEQKPEIDTKIAYYKETMLGIDSVMDAIDKRIKRGYIKESFRILFLPVNKRVYLDDYDKARLLLEKKRAGLDLFEKKRYFEMWLERKKQYEEKFAEIEKECNLNYDRVYEMAKEVCKYNMRLKSVFDAYKNENNDIKIKVEFYLYIKQEVENAIKHGRISRDFTPEKESVS